jgi:hypothetical protein
VFRIGQSGAFAGGTCDDKGADSALNLEFNESSESLKVDPRFGKGRGKSGSCTAKNGVLHNSSFPQKKRQLQNSYRLIPKQKFPREGRIALRITATTAGILSKLPAGLPAEKVCFGTHPFPSFTPGELNEKGNLDEVRLYLNLENTTGRGICQGFPRKIPSLIHL